MSGFWRGKRVLVTGAGGFIGSHLAESLVREGARLRAMIRYDSRGDPGMLAHLPSDAFDMIDLVAGDLRDPYFTLRAVEDMDYVFHLGALISIPYSYINPYEVAETNFMGTLLMLQACQEQEVRRFIHASSSEVYGSAQRVPIDELHALQGQSPYSASKIGADKLVESFHASYGLPAVTVRPFNTYGPRQSARAVIPTIISQALTKGTIRLGSLDGRRDFTYVSDTVDGLLKAGMAEGVEGKVLNLGTGQDFRIGDLANRIIRLIGRPVKIVVDPTRVRPKESEVMRLLSDNSRAKQYLNWDPSILLEDGLQLTIRWIREHLGMYRIGTYEL